MITPISLAFLCLFIHGLSFYSALIDNEILERIDMLIERRRSGVYEAMKSLNDLSIKSMMVAVYSCNGIPDVRQFKGRYGLEGLSPEKLARYLCGKGYIFRLISVELFYLVIVLCIFGNCVNHWDFTCLQLLAMCKGILLGSALLLCFWWVAPLLSFWGNKRGAMKVYGEIILRFSEKSESLPSWMTVRAFSPFRSLVWNCGGSRKWELLVYVAFVIGIVFCSILYWLYCDYETWIKGAFGVPDSMIYYENTHIAFLFFAFAFSFSLVCILLLFWGNETFWKGNDVALANTIPDLIESWEHDSDVLKLIESAGRIEAEENIAADSQRETAKETTGAVDGLKDNSTFCQGEGQSTQEHAEGSHPSLADERGKINSELMTWIDAAT